jgi:hypothetical protein
MSTGRLKPKLNPTIKEPFGASKRKECDGVPRAAGADGIDPPPVELDGLNGDGRNGPA